MQSQAIEHHLPDDIRALLEDRFWRTVETGATLEALRGDEALALAPDTHPALFADHGVVHARDVAHGVIELASTVEGVLLPARPPERQAFVVGLAVAMSYLHDVGMQDPTPVGRRLHALAAAQLPFSGAIDDALARLWDEKTPVTERIVDVARAAPFAVPDDVVLRELLSLAAAHSKSTVPHPLLADYAALRRVMQRAVLVDLAERRNASRTIAPDDPWPATLADHARWYERPEADAFAWLDSAAPEQRALADDAIDAVRLLRAADALRQRGTQLRTAAGYEIFLDGESGSAVFALRAAGNDRLLLLRVDSPLSAGEANLRSAAVTPKGDLRIVLHRGRFGSSSASASASAATARVVADIAHDVLGSFAARPSSGVLPAPARDPESARLELERPTDEPGFADAVAEALAHDAWLASRVAVVAALEHAAFPERERYHRADVVHSDINDVHEILQQLAERGMKVESIEPDTAFEDVRRARLAADEVLVEAGSAPAFVYVPVEDGLQVQPTGGYDAEDVPAWLPVGITGVVRRAERNSTIVATTPLDVLMIPGELFLRAWFRPYEQREIGDLFARAGRQ